MPRLPGALRLLQTLIKSRSPKRHGNTPFSRTRRQARQAQPRGGGRGGDHLRHPRLPSGRFAFEPGQFLTLRATIDGQDVRRSYSISSPRSRLARNGELEIGIRPVEGGLFSNWATRAIKAGDTLR
jgi:ring-1,2-phenylacetyl-CoA epoxidase subunit PaaE